MGDYEARTLVLVESSLRYHSVKIWILTLIPQITGQGTVSGRQFDWGGRLLKSNGGVQRFPQVGRKSTIECISRRELDCETNKSSRYESRIK